jgi:hypothetical protein
MENNGQGRQEHEQKLKEERMNQPPALRVANPRRSTLSEQFIAPGKYKAFPRINQHVAARAWPSPSMPLLTLAQVEHEA